jgi:hypothetical protein
LIAKNLIVCKILQPIHNKTRIADEKTITTKMVHTRSHTLRKQQEEEEQERLLRINYKNEAAKEKCEELKETIDDQDARLEDVNHIAEWYVEQVQELKEENEKLKAKCATKDYKLTNGIVIQATQSEIDICEKYEKKSDKQFEEWCEAVEEIKTLKEEIKELRYEKYQDNEFRQDLGHIMINHGIDEMEQIDLVFEKTLDENQEVKEMNERLDKKVGELQKVRETDIDLDLHNALVTKLREEIDELNKKKGVKWSREFAMPLIEKLKEENVAKEKELYIAQEGWLSASETCTMLEGLPLSMCKQLEDATKEEIEDPTRFYRGIKAVEELQKENECWLADDDNLTGVMYRTSQLLEDKAWASVDDIYEIVEDLTVEIADLRSESNILNQFKERMHSSRLILTEVGEHARAEGAEDYAIYLDAVYDFLHGEGTDPSIPDP